MDEKESFYSAINRLTISLFQLSTFTENDMFIMSNPYLYELMCKLLSGYYKSIEKIIFIIFDDFCLKTKK